MQIEREFIERRTATRRAAIRAGLAELHDRRGAMQQADNARCQAFRLEELKRVSNWLARFDAARARVNSA